MNYKTLWIMIANYSIAFGVFFDMCIQPITNIWKPVAPIDYESLALILGLVLGIKGARDIGITGYGKGKRSTVDCER